MYTTVVINNFLTSMIPPEVSISYSTRSIAIDKLSHFEELSSQLLTAVKEMCQNRLGQTAKKF